MDTKPLSISQLNILLDQLLSADPLLANITIQAEVTQIKSYPNRHYITLSDATSQHNAILFPANLNGQAPPKQGDQILAKGRPKLFTKKGTLQFQINWFKPLDAGQLNAAFEKLKAKLLEEGLFDPERKQPVPRYPKHVTLITADESAAFWDVVSLKEKLADHLQLSLIPATVQGNSAPQSLCHALQKSHTNATDIVIVMRGGGSANDLSCFNDESVVRAVAACPHPTIAAIGHDVDITLTDFVADLRCATPSNAIHTIAEPFIAAKQQIHELLNTSYTNIRRHIQTNAQHVQHTVQLAQQKLEKKTTDLSTTLTHLIQLADSSSPLQKLAQGYSIAAHNDKTLTSIHDITPGDTMTTRVADGTIISTCLSKKN